MMLELQAVAPIGDQGIVGLFAEEAVQGLAQPASLNGSPPARH
jgi:hypothetical protein